MGESSALPPVHTTIGPHFNGWLTFFWAVPAGALLDWMGSSLANGFLLQVGWGGVG